MTKQRSAFSISVGRRKANGYRDVTLLHRGHPVFCVSHREVQWTFLGYFHVPGERPSADKRCFGFQGEEDGLNASRPPQEFLCVFHREELKDAHDRYVVSQPTTLCSAYAVRDGTDTVLALQGFTPSSIAPGRTGVFVQGMKQNVRGGLQTDATLELEGATFIAAVDACWMASPLVMKPVYIRTDWWAQPPGDDGCDANELPFLPGFQRAAFGPSTYPPALHLPGGMAYLGAQVLFQFSPAGGEDSTTFAIMRRGAEELGLAITRPVHHLDAMTLEWLPHRASVPGLSPNAAALAFTISEHALFAGRQVIFLYDSAQRNVHVLRLSGLALEAGRAMRESQGWGEQEEAMEVLFTLPNADFPLFVPSLREASPQPVLVCNYPNPKDVTLLNPMPMVEISGKVALERCILAHRSVAAGTTETFSVARNSQSERWSAEEEEEEEEGQHSRMSHVDACEPLRIVAVEYQDGTDVAFRCEVRDDFGYLCDEGQRVTVAFPSLQTEKDALLTCVLEVLEATVGRDAVYGLEVELIRSAWRRESGEDGDPSAPLDFSSACLSLILGAVRGACGGDDAERHAAPIPAQQDLLSERLLAALLNPLALTADGVSAAAMDVIEGTPAQPVVHWSLPMAAQATVALHLLCESCRIQESLRPFVDKLADCLRALSAALRWDAYEAYYDPLHFQMESSSTGMPCETPLLTVSYVRERFSFISEESERTSSAAAGTHTEGWSPARDGSRVRTCGSLPSGLPTPDRTASNAPDSHDGTAAAAATTLWRNRESEVASHPLCVGEPVHLFTCLSHVLERSRAETETGAPWQAADAWPLLRGLPSQHPVSVANDVFRCFCSAAMAKTTRGSPCDRDVSLPWWWRVCNALASPDATGSCLTGAIIAKELSIGVAFPLLSALGAGRHHLDSVPADNDVFAAAVGRLDRVKSPALLATLADAGKDVIRLAEERAVSRQYQATLTDDDGVMMRLDFPHVWRDSRLDSAQVYFNTSRPVRIPTGTSGDQPADILKSLSLRVCAMPLGRGMLTMATHNFKVRDSIPVPRLNLQGRTSDGVFVANTTRELQPDFMVWPLFHNGCAAGLRFLPLSHPAAAGMTADARMKATTMDGEGKEGVITRHWVVYQTKTVAAPAARAGVLLAAGIFGHLKVLQLTDIYSLLVSPRVHFNGREATTMAVMLGLSCSFRGTNNDLVFRCLSMHVQSLTPSAEEIDVSLDVQTCALVSMGVLCQRSPTNSFLVDVFLMEMTRLPSDEHCVHREGYALAAGFGLGLLLLGLGAAHGIAHVEERLFNLLEGGRRDAAAFSRDGGIEAYEERSSDEAGNFLSRALLMQARKTASQTTCTRVFEGDYYNAAVSSPAAAVALGLTFLKTEDASAAAKLMPPDRLSGLQAVLPLLCLLRTCFAALTCWSEVEATHDYIHKKCVPTVLQNLTAKTGTELRLDQQQVHYLMMNHGHCIAGAVLAVGLRFAGSMDTRIRDLLLAELKGFLKGFLGATKIGAPTLQRSTGAYEMCITTCCTAVALVMAGTGDLRTSTVLQRVHSRPNASFGTHMALSMSLGLLFLGGGRLSLSTSTESVAALLLAFYPVWPKDPENNVHHLQILRHLYGLAVVPRVLETVDVVSNRPVSVPVKIVLRPAARTAPTVPHGAVSGTRSSGARAVGMETPCLYPPPETIERIEMKSTRHYHCVLRNETGAHGGLIGEHGLVVRILEKGTNATRTDEWRSQTPMSPWERGGKEEGEEDGVVASRRWRNLAELRLLDDVRLLFSRQGTSRATPLILLDNIALLAVSQKCLATLSPLPQQGTPTLTERGAEGTVSADVCRAVTHTLLRRYRALFAHGPAGTCVQHPLHRVLVNGEPWTAVVDAIVVNPSGTSAFPVDFTALCSARSGAAPADGYDGVAGVDRDELERWLAEALQFHFGSSCELRRLRDAIRAMAPQLRVACTRTFATLKVNQQVHLPFPILQQLVVCCFGD